MQKLAKNLVAGDVISLSTGLCRVVGTKSFVSTYALPGQAETAVNVQVVPGGAVPGQEGRYLGFWKATHVDTLNRKFAPGATIGDREARECGPPPLRAPTTAFCQCGWSVTVEVDDSRISAQDMDEGQPWMAAADYPRTIPDAAVTPTMLAARCASRLLAEHRRDKHPKRVRLGKGA